MLIMLCKGLCIGPILSCGANLNKAIATSHIYKSWSKKTSILLIHTLQLNFLFSDWLFRKYVECIKSVQNTPRTAPRLREVLLVRDRVRERHIDWSIFFTGQNCKFSSCLVAF